MSRIKLLLCLGWIGTILSTTVYAQSQKEFAKQYYKAENYAAAIPVLQELFEQKQKSDYQYQLGVAHFHTGAYEKALEYLQSYEKKEERPDLELYWYKARAYHMIAAYEKAALSYKAYIRRLGLGKKYAARRAYTKHLILQCVNGNQRAFDNAKVIITPTGDINTIWDEYAIVKCLRFPQHIYYNSTQFKAAIDTLRSPKDQFARPSPITNMYSSQLRYGNWENGKRLAKRYCDPSKNECLVNFIDQGYAVVYAQENRLYVDNFDKDTLKVALPFAQTVLDTFSDAEDFYLYKDSLLFFSSRIGGYGGKDLYYTYLDKDSSWATAVNLGPEINTPHDEATPFLAKNGLVLYFSSNGKNSIGGYDVFRAEFSLRELAWKKAISLKNPINSPGDDLFFRLQNDGMQAHVSSDRNGSKGGLDLYTVYFRQPVEEELKIETLNFAKLLVAPDTSKLLVDLVIPEDTIAKVIHKDTFTVSPIFYDRETGEMKGTQVMLNTIKKMNTKASAANTIYTITAHSDKTGTPSYDLFMSVKQGETLARELVKLGIEEDQIRIHGCGHSYPIAVNTNISGRKMNCRLKLSLHKLDTNAIHIQQKEIMVSAVMAMGEGVAYEGGIEGLTYKIFLSKTANILEHPLLSVLSGLTAEKGLKEDKIKYFVGFSKTYIEAETILSLVREQGFSEAKIVPYIDGYPLEDRTGVKRYEEQYPDLKEFLKQN
ncbi:MAG: hypothetical protein MK212_06885 [Saprospiraceae bacterium]|nr:hypothetical protein [Saprospiraceae bacterium]